MTVIHTDTDLEHWSRECWLGHCEGFRMEDRARKLGIVEEIVAQVSFMLAQSNSP